MSKKAGFRIGSGRGKQHVLVVAIEMNSTDSNSRPSALFPELPSASSGGLAGGGSFGLRSALRRTAFLASRVGMTLLRHAVSVFLMPLLRLPPFEFMALMLILALGLFSLA
ncbi:MAG: hypothetical protein H6895_04925 [Defluviimonas sp.]|uniref:hypothetical protein n=1 Tax=Albidovulum sp. TaxID=1872424 RepID=UPI002A33C55B|nr:hypothetical protein [Defluviimonas sp.]